MNGQEQAVANAARSMTVEANLDAQLKQAFGLLIRGCLVSAPNVPPDMILRSIARVTGNCLSLGLMGDIASVLRLRAEMKEAFTKAVDEVKPQPMPASPLQNGRG